MNKPINKPTVAIIACVKMEELYIKEWLDYYIKLGVNHFYLCDNNNSNYFPKLIDVVKDYIDKGIVDIYDFCNIHPIQPICYTYIYHTFGHLYDWFGILDIDEYVELNNKYNTINEFLGDKKFNNVDAIYLFWRLYGDNDNIYYENKPLQERFKNPINTINRTDNLIRPQINDGRSNIIKSFIKNRNKLSIKNFDIFHHHSLSIKPQIIACDCYGNLTKQLQWKMENTLDYNDSIYIKHYITKSLEEFANKIIRGSCKTIKGDRKFPYDWGKYFGYNIETEEKKKFLLEKYGIQR